MTSIAVAFGACGFAAGTLVTIGVMMHDNVALATGAIITSIMALGIVIL